MNIALKIVTQPLPATMFAGMTDHCRTNGSPPLSSSRKTDAFIGMIVSVRSRPFHTVIERIELIVSTIGGIVDRKRYRVSRILWLD
jgi:hypothetical protein